MKLKRTNHKQEQGRRTTLVIFVDCDEEDFGWVQKRCVKAVEKELDEAVGNIVWLDGDIHLSWKKDDEPCVA